MKFTHHLAATATLALAALAAQATPIAVDVDVSGAQSINLQGEAGNTVWLVNIGAGSVLNSLDWNVNLSSFGSSSLSEMQISFGSSSGLDLITFSPGAADTFSGSGNYTGSLDLSAYGVTAGADGQLRIEFSEAFKDFNAGVAEGQWVSGNLTLGVNVGAVPEPASATLALLGLGLIAGARRIRCS